MTAPDPFYETAPANATEPKVTAAYTGAGAGFIISNFLIYIIGQVWCHGGLPPVEITMAVGLAVTSGLSFAGGYLARHVQRPAPVAPVAGGMAQGEAG